MIGTIILQSLETAEPATQELYHFWKAATTSLVAPIGALDGRDERVMEVIVDLSSLLGSLAVNLDWDQFVASLTDIVHQAVALDEMLCYQQGWFFLRYPAQRSDIFIDQEEMELEQSVAPGEIVKFVIRPALWRAGKGAQDANGLRLLKRHLVFV